MKIRVKVKPLYFLIFFAFLIFSCASLNREASPLHEEPDDSQSKKINKGLSALNMKTEGKASISDYVIGPGDLLDIDVFQVPDLKTSVRVSATGDVKLPLVGKIKAGGLSVSELETELSGELEKYLEEPVVSVFIKEYRSQQIAVIGAVKNPQVYFVSGQKNLLDMLSMAGGLSEEAGSICYVQRAYNEASPMEYYKTIIIDLDELLLKGQVHLNVSMSSGDVIHVPKNGVFFVDGAVNSPGSFQLKGKITITQALSMSKGLKYGAERSDIRIYRDNGKTGREIVPIDYDSVLEGKSIDISINDKDIIIVPESEIKNFFSGFINTVKGIFSFGKSL
jgi:polysaccharide export outer membrane protein